MSGFVGRCLGASMLVGMLTGTIGHAQEAKDSSFGGYEPNGGFKVAKTEKGELNIRLFTYVRYLNQLGLDTSYTDSFGKTTAVDRRQDIQIQKVMVFFQGWLMDPKLRYVAYVWTANTSQGLGAQVVVAGSLNYIFNEHLTIGGGVDGLPGVRSTEGNFPFWLTSDNRLMADEYFRPSFSMGLWARGKVAGRLSYRAMLANNLSQLGVDAGQLDNQLDTYGLGLIWLPTTGEFGTRGAVGDLDGHKQVATRLAAHFTSSDEDRQGQPNTEAFENVQIRISDGNSIFAPNLFGNGIQVDKAAYRMFATDGGIKYRGMSLDGEFYWRRIENFRGTGTERLPFETLNDHGFQLQASAMVMPGTLQAYAGSSKVFGEYGDPSEWRLGVNWYPYHNHVVRLNTEFLHTTRSPVGAFSLPYTVGGNGNVVYSSFQVNF